jgi:hypothetical protein
MLELKRLRNLGQKSRGVYLVKDRFVWSKIPKERAVERPLALHGTSSVLLEGIMKDGLRAQLPLLSKEDTDIYNGFFGPQGIHEERSLTLTTDPAAAVRFARTGSATLSHMREKLQNHVRINGELPSTPEGKKLEAIRGALERFRKAHRPVVLLIDYEGYPNPDQSIERLRMLDGFPAVFEGLDQQDCSAWEVLRSLRDRHVSQADRFQYLIRDSCYDCGGRLDLRVDENLIRPGKIKAVVKVK